MFEAEAQVVRSRSGQLQRHSEAPDRHPEAWAFRNADAREGICSPRSGVGLGCVNAQSVDVCPDEEKGKEARRAAQSRLAAAEQGLER